LQDGRRLDTANMRPQPYQRTALHLFANILMWLTCLCASTALAGSPKVLSVPPDRIDVLLGQHMQVLLDDSGKQTLDTLRTQQAAWQPSPADAINFGLTQAVGWARVSLRNDSTEDMSRVLDLDSALIDYVDVYVLRPDGVLIGAASTGDRKPFATRPLKLRTLAMPLHIQAGEQIEVYLRFQTHDGLHEIILPRLWQAPAFATHMQTETMAFGLYYGVLVTVLLYNLFLFVSTRQASFGYYLAYVACLLAWAFSFRGYAFQYLWPRWPSFNNQALLACAGMSYVTLSMFAISYLDTRHSVPSWLHRALVFCTGACMLAVLPFLYNYYAWPFVAQSALGVVLIGIIVVINALLLWRGSRPARYFSSAFAALSLGVLLYYLRLMGLVPANALTDNFLQIGSAAEALLLAFGLADQMNTLKSDKLQAEQEALAAQTALNTQLESLVSARTTELQQVNERLTSLSITDELTGAYNRRQFNKDLAAAVALHGRHQTPAVLCLIDVDHFKAFNDRYGHPAGDDALQRIAAVIQKAMHRASDRLYRVGGEEFAILLDINEPAEKVQAFIDTMCQRIQEAGIVHEASPEGVITISMGLMILNARGATMSAQELYSAADALLYEAKRAGRNQVKSQVRD
jgi:diguanylate cyclase (GGDEF)-like protein